jgi:hypothetical protein
MGTRLPITGQPEYLLRAFNGGVVRGKSLQVTITADAAVQLDEGQVKELRDHLNREWPEEERRQMGMHLQLNIHVGVDLDRAGDHLSLNITNQFKMTGPMKLTRAEALVMGLSILEQAKTLPEAHERT